MSRSSRRRVPNISDPWADMIASGEITPAEDSADVADEAPSDFGGDASAVLAEMRADERRGCTRIPGHARTWDNAAVPGCHPPGVGHLDRC
jgi:hypothetical protein